MAPTLRDYERVTKATKLGVCTLGITMQLSFVSLVQGFPMKSNQCTGFKEIKK